MIFCARIFRASCWGNLRKSYCCAIGWIGCKHIIAPRMLTQTLLFLDNVCSSVRLFEFMQKVYLTIDTDAHIMIGEVKVKVRFTYLAMIKPHMPPQRCCASQTGPSFSLGRCSSPQSRILTNSEHTIRKTYKNSGRAPTSATEPSVQLDLQSGTICRRTSDSRTCHTAVSDGR